MGEDGVPSCTRWGHHRSASLRFVPPAGFWDVTMVASLPSLWSRIRSNRVENSVTWGHHVLEIIGVLLVTATRRHVSDLIQKLDLLLQRWLNVAPGRELAAAGQAALR